MLHGKHPAFFTTYPKHPIRLRREQESHRQQQWQTSRRVEERSYAAQLTGPGRQQPAQHQGPNVPSPSFNISDLERIITQVIERLVPAQFLNSDHGY